MGTWYEPSSSFRNMFVIEEETPSDTGEILWKQPCRFKLLGTDKYLATMVTEDAEDKGSAYLILTDEVENKSTLFSFDSTLQVSFNSVKTLRIF